MGRRAIGSIYVAAGAMYLSITLDRRRHFPLSTCRSKEEAEVRRHVIADVANQLKRAGKLRMAEAICRQLATTDSANLAGILQLVDGIVRGTEQPAAPRPLGLRAPSATMTVREFGNLWTSNELSKRHTGRVREIGQEENTRRLKNHIYPSSLMVERSVTYRSTSSPWTWPTTFLGSQACRVALYVTSPNACCGS